MGHKILITGGGGMLGRALTERLPDAVTLTRQDGDLRDPRAVKALFETHKPHLVVHLAARVGGVKSNAEHNAEYLSDNVRINVNVLDAAKDCGVKRLISLLSSCAYKTTPERSSTESDLHEGLPYAGNLGYGMAKRMLEIQSQLITKRGDCEFSTLTPMTLYGPYDQFDLHTGHVVASLIHKCFKAKQSGGPLTVWGSGQAVRQFVYVKDVARMLEEWIQKGFYFDNLIMAPDEGMTIQELAVLISEAFDFKGPIEYDTSFPEGEKIRRLTSSKFKHFFPDFKTTDLKQALKETVDWYVSNLSREVPHG